MNKSKEKNIKLNHDYYNQTNQKNCYFSKSGMSTERQIFSFIYCGPEFAFYTQKL